MKQREIRAGLDTSVLMRLLVGQPEPLAEVARAFLAETEEAGAALFVSNLVLSEAYFACQHHYGIQKAEVLKGLGKLLSASTFFVPASVLPLLALEGIASAKPGFLDRVIHAEYAALGLMLVTFEKAASSLVGTRVLGK